MHISSTPEIFIAFTSAAPSAPPQHVSGEVFNSSAITVRWQSPPFNRQNGVVVNYTVNIVEQITSRVLIITTNGPHTEMFVTSLHPYYIYEFAVAAETVALGPYSEINTVRTDEDGM